MLYFICKQKLKLKLKSVTNGSNNDANSHCEQGVDRTSELLAAVELAQGATWQSALADAFKIAGGRALQTSNEHALRWYCAYLAFRNNDHTDDPFDSLHSFQAAADGEQFVKPTANLNCFDDNL